MKLHGFKFDWLQRIRAAEGHVLIVGPTGCGKTVVATQLMMEGRVLFVAHTRELIAQAYKRCVEWGIPERDIGVILGGNRSEGEEHLLEDYKRRVQIASKQTLERRKEWPSAKFVIFDEAHHVPSKGFAKIFTHYAKGSKIYGLTATPLRLDQKELGNYFTSLVQAPPTSELVASGHIVTPRVWVPKEGRPDLREAKLNERDFDRKELSETMRNKTIVGSLVEHWERLGEGLPTVVYAVDVEHANVIAERMRAAGIKAEVLSGETPIPERNNILKRFDVGQLRVIVNVQVLTEGWDCPAAKCIVLARPTMSLGLVMQMIGRASRPKNGTVPRVLDLVGNFPHFTREGYDLIGDNEFELHYSKVTPKKGEPKYKVCPNCEELVPLGTQVCECGHEFWKKGMPQEERGDLQEWFPKKAPSPFTEEQLADFARMYCDGESTISIARKHSCGVTSVRNALHRMGVNVRTIRTREPYTEEQIAEFGKQFSSGKSIRDIAVAVGGSRTGVRTAMVRSGITVSRVRDQESIAAAAAAERAAREERVKKKQEYQNDLQLKFLAEKEKARVAAIKNKAKSEKVLEAVRFGRTLPKIQCDPKWHTAIDLYRAGFSTAQIGDYLNRDDATIYKAIAGYVKFRAKGNRKLNTTVAEWIGQHGTVGNAG